MLNFYHFKFKTGIKIVAAFLIFLQAVFLLQKVLAGSPSTLVAKPLTDKVGFNLVWSFNSSDSSATYFLLKSSVTTFLSCPLVPSLTMPNMLLSGKNTTVYNMNVGDVVPGIKYSFKACLYGSNNLMSEIINTPNLLEETNTASVIFTTVSDQLVSEEVATTTIAEIIDTSVETIATTTTTIIQDVVATTTDPVDVVDVVDVVDPVLDDQQPVTELSADVVPLDEEIVPEVVATTTIIQEQVVDLPIIKIDAVATSSVVKEIKPIVNVVKEPVLKKVETKTVNVNKKEVAKKTPTVSAPVVNKTIKKPVADVNKKELEKKNLAVAIDALATSTQPAPTDVSDGFNKFPKACVANNILNETACNNYLFGEATRETKCADGGDGCLSEAREKYLNGITNTQLKLEAVEKVATENTGGVMSVGGLKDALATYSDVVTLRDDTTGVKIVKSESRISYQDDKIIQTGSSILMIDSDNDGLSDDIERKIGTDINSKDTDADGYSDHVEYTSGYNPLGAGKLATKNVLAPVEMAIVNNEIIEQPKSRGLLHEDFVAESVTNLSTTTSNNASGYLLQGKATPNTVISLYIYSDLPLMITVKTDDYGNWKYELKQSLSDGEHEVYVALNDATGKVVAKSNPLSFLVKEAQAASLTDVVLNNEAPTIESENNNIFVYYLLISGVSVLAGVIIFINLVKRKRNSDV